MMWRFENENISRNPFTIEHSNENAGGCPFSPRSGSDADEESMCRFSDGSYVSGADSSDPGWLDGLYFRGEGVVVSDLDHYLGGEIDRQFNLTLYITGVVFVLSQLGLAWAVWRYRDQGQRATFSRGNNTFEV